MASPRNSARSRRDSDDADAPAASDAGAAGASAGVGVIEKIGGHGGQGLQRDDGGGHGGRTHAVSANEAAQPRNVREFMASTPVRAPTVREPRHRWITLPPAVGDSPSTTRAGSVTAP